MEFKRRVVLDFKNIQNDICHALETEDGKAKFHEDEWKREGGGGGLTRIISNGNVFEKGGVNFSAVHGVLPEVIAKEFKTEDATFFATGVSIVIHPNNPFVPIIHMNIRYFEMGNGKRWFGGGIDMTPHYIDPDEAAFFHDKLRSTCNNHDQMYYPKFKKWADDYFFIKHRNETRGIGGIFFDKLEPEEKAGESIFNFVREIGNTFIPCYLPIVQKNKSRNFIDKHKTWQLLRRGRYVEFNLVYDRGTKFGLETNGRIESILMSLPEHASWKYNVIPEKNSAEEYTLNHLKRNIEWV